MTAAFAWKNVQISLLCVNTTRHVNALITWPLSSDLLSSSSARMMIIVSRFLATRTKVDTPPKVLHTASTRPEYLSRNLSKTTSCNNAVLVISVREPREALWEFGGKRSGGW